MIVLYLFDVYALVVGTVAVVALAVWLTFYALLLGGVAIVRRLRVVAEGHQGHAHASARQPEIFES